MTLGVMSPDLTVTPDLDQPASREWTDEQDTTLRLWVALDRCHSTCAKAIAAKAKEYGLTAPQLGTLEALYPRLLRHRFLLLHQK